MTDIWEFSPARSGRSDAGVGDPRTVVGRVARRDRRRAARTRARTTTTGRSATPLTRSTTASSTSRSSGGRMSGKSTLFNRLVGEDRSVVHDMPGTTRDAIDTVVETEDGPLRFVDTAGLRRKSRIDEPTEYYSLVRALEAIDRADAALLVIDASEGVTHQDQRLAERIDAAGTAVTIICNKWDLLDAEDREKVRRQVADMLGLPELRADDPDLRAERPACASAAARAAGVGERVPPAHPDRRSSTGSSATRRTRTRRRWSRSTGLGSCTRPRARPIRRRSRSSRAVRCRISTCGTSSASCGSRSISGRPRSSCRVRARTP